MHEAHTSTAERTDFFRSCIERLWNLGISRFLNVEGQSVEHFDVTSSFGTAADRTVDERATARRDVAYTITYYRFGLREAFDIHDTHERSVEVRAILIPWSWASSS